MLGLILTLMLIMSFVQISKGADTSEKVKTAGFKDLFKRKPGGTVVGNLARGIASKVTGLDFSNFLKLPPDGGAPVTKGILQKLKQNITAKVSADKGITSGGGGFSDYQNIIDDSSRGLDQRIDLSRRSKFAKFMWPTDKKFFAQPGNWILGVPLIALTIWGIVRMVKGKKNKFSYKR